jgi:hypothetical protein
MEAVTAENRGAGDLLRGAKKIAGFLTDELGETITETTVFYWSSVKKIRTRKFGAHLVASKTELREDIRGQAA